MVGPARLLEVIKKGEGIAYGCALSCFVRCRQRRSS